MPDYTFTTDADDEAAIARWMAKNPEGNVGLTVQQVLRRVLRQWLTARVGDWKEDQRTQLKAAYEKASTADKAAIDLLLDKYRGIT